MSTPDVGQYWVLLEDAATRSATHCVYIPAPVAWQESPVSIATPYANSMRPVTNATVVKVTVVLPLIFSGLGATPGGQRGYMKGHFMPEPRLRGFHGYKIPGWKNDLADFDEHGVLSVINVTGATASLVDAWLSGIGGVKPSNGSGYFRSCNTGRLRK
jgi:hypothetical protein